MKYILIIISIICSTSVPCFSATYYVDKDSTGGECSDTNNGTALTTPWCTIEKANATVAPGDTVNIRAGTYSVSSNSTCASATPKTCGINPATTGTSDTAEGRITYQPYLTETVNLAGVDGAYSIGIWITGKSYIKVTGTSLGQLNLSNMAVSLLLGPRSGTDNPIGDTSYNEISYIASVGRTGAASDDHQQQNLINKQAFFNHIHHNKFESFGYSTTPNGNEHGNLFDLGLEQAASASRRTYYNVIENNEFLHAGHATFGWFGEHNVIRNNYFHNEGWYSYDGKLYAYRNIIGDGYPDYVGYNIFEGNRIGHAGPNYNGTTGGEFGGTGMKVCHPYNIIRYNSIFNNSHTALSLSTYSAPYNAKPIYNRIYNNSFYHNGHYLNLPGEDYLYTNVISLTYTSDYSVILHTDFKNNLFYDNGNTHNSRPVFWFDNAHLPLTDATDPAKGAMTIENNFNGALTYSTETDPTFADANAVDISDPTSSTLPTLLLDSTSSTVDYGTSYLTTATKKDDNTMTFADSRYFQDGNFGTGSALAWPSSVTVAADYVCFSTTTKATSCTNKQIVAINYATGDVTITGHGLTAETTYYVWLYKDSDGTQVLYGEGSDAGAHEFDNSGTPPSYTVSVSKTGASSDHCSLSHTGDYSVATGSTQNVSATIDNGHQAMWSGTCSSTGGVCSGNSCTTRVCTPSEDDQTMVLTCTPIQVIW